MAEVDSKIHSLRNEVDELRKMLSQHESKIADLNTSNQRYKDQIMNVSSALVDAKEMARIIVDRAQAEADGILEDTNNRSSQAWSLMHKQLNDFEKIKNTIIDYEGTMKLEALQLMTTYANKIKEIDLDKHQATYARSIEKIIDSGKYQLDEVQKSANSVKGVNIAQADISSVVDDSVKESTSKPSEYIVSAASQRPAVASVSETESASVSVSVSIKTDASTGSVESSDLARQSVASVSTSLASKSTSDSTSAPQPSTAAFLNSVLTSASAVSEMAQSLVGSVSESTSTSQSTETSETSVVSSLSVSTEVSETPSVEEDTIPIVTFWED